MESILLPNSIHGECTVILSSFCFLLYCLMELKHNVAIIITQLMGIDAFSGRVERFYGS